MIDTQHPQAPQDIYTYVLIPRWFWLFLIGCLAGATTAILIAAAITLISGSAWWPNIMHESTVFVNGLEIAFLSLLTAVISVSLAIGCFPRQFRSKSDPTYKLDVLRWQPPWYDR